MPALSSYPEVTGFDGDERIPLVDSPGVPGGLAYITADNLMAAVVIAVDEAIAAHISQLHVLPDPDEPPGVNGTATPAVVARTVVTPAPIAAGSGNGTATPTAIARTVVTPAPTVTPSSGNGTATPATVARTVVIPAPLTSPMNNALLLAAVNRGDAVIDMQGAHLFLGAGEAVVLRGGQHLTNGWLTVTVLRGAYGAKAVVSELTGVSGNVVSNMKVDQTYDQFTYNATSDPDTYMVAGFHMPGNAWELRDVHADKVSFGMDPGAGSVGGGIRRIKRMLITRWGYYGDIFLDSGNGVYYQSPDTFHAADALEVEDLVMQVGTKIGWHDHATFSMSAPRQFNGVALMNVGVTDVTGGSGDSTMMYFSRVKSIDIQHAHFIQHRANANVFNKAGYGGFVGTKFEADDVWALAAPDMATYGFTPQSTFTEGFTLTNFHNFNVPADRSAFAGVKPLGPTWSICYGTVPGGYEQVPGTITFPAQFGMPAVTVVKAAA